MAEFVTWSATATVVVLLLAFAWHLISLRHLPTTERPRTNVYDRQGHVVGRQENPEMTDSEQENW